MVSLSVANLSLRRLSSMLAVVLLHCRLRRDAVVVNVDAEVIATVGSSVNHQLYSRHLLWHVLADFSHLHSLADLSMECCRLLGLDHDVVYLHGRLGWPGILMEDRLSSLGRALGYHNR